MPVKSFAIPIADADGPYTVEYGMPVTFDGSGSSAGGDYIVSWEWDLDYDGSYDDAAGETVTVSSTTFWPGPGSYTVGLEVTDWTDGVFGVYETDYDTAGLIITEPGPVPAVPEPATILLLVSGLLGLFAFRRKFER